MREGSAVARLFEKGSGFAVADEVAEEAKTGLVFVDPDQGSRMQAESLEEVLARSVLAVDPSEFKPAESAEIQQAAGIIVAWDLGFYSGADLLEEIRSSESLKDCKVLISMDAPTRSGVVLAMELGADGVCCRPYEEAELSACLDRAGLPRKVTTAPER